MADKDEDHELLIEVEPVRFRDSAEIAALFAEEDKPGPTLFDLAKKEGYTLVIDPNPQGRPDALGNTGWQRVASAQLCKGNIIAVTEDLPNATYCISHEIAHGKVGFNEEKQVLCEQASILAGWVKTLLDHIQKEPTT
jgi:hypothetical protein